MQNNWEAAVKKVRDASTRIVVVAKDRDATATKYEDRPVCAEQRMGFENVEMACLETRVVTVMRKQDAITTKRKTLSPEVQYVLGLAGEAYRLRERMLAFESVALLKILKGG